MDLIFLYGPPGVGKLTVGTALAAHTGYKLLHNHLTIDLVTTLFPFGSESFGRLVDRFRLALLAEAARADLPGVITTLVYAHGDDDRFVAQTIAAVEAHGGRVCPVLLTCAEDELLRRAGQESRARHGKLHDPAQVRALLSRYRLTTPIPQRESLIIDTTDHAPTESALVIVRHFGLPESHLQDNET